MTGKIKQKLQLDPDEMAFRKIYWPLLKNEQITVIFRPSVRLCGDYRGYCIGQKVKARVIDKVGADWAMIPPKFVRGFFKKIIIEKVEIKKIGGLKREDFMGSSPDIQGADSLVYDLGVVYNLFIDELNRDTFVTKITFSYDHGKRT